MDDTALIFDDWAMFLAGQWLEAHEACEIRKQIYIDGKINFEAVVRREQSLNETHALLYALVEYLKTALEYDGLLHRRGYAQYITLDAAHVDALMTLIAYMHEGEPEGYRSFVRNRSKRKMLEKYLIARFRE